MPWPSKRKRQLENTREVKRQKQQPGIQMSTTMMSLRPKMMFPTRMAKIGVRKAMYLTKEILGLKVKVLCTTKKFVGRIATQKIRMSIN